MITIYIKSSKLPSIGEPTKIMINQGQWFLFETNKNAHSRSSFTLIAGDTVYYLDSKGVILRAEHSRPANLEVTKTVYFSDLPKPISISNAELP